MGTYSREQLSAALRYLDYVISKVRISKGPEIPGIGPYDLAGKTAVTREALAAALNQLDESQDRRSCRNCAHEIVCHVRRALFEMYTRSGAQPLDASLPGYGVNLDVIYKATARMCSQFKENAE